MSSSNLRRTTFDMSLLRSTLWCVPSWTIARFLLRSHVRSGWILGDIVFIWLLYVAFFFEFGGDVAYFYGVMNQALTVLAVLSTIVMTQRALTARMYLPLAKLSSRAAYIRGLLLATGLLRVPSFLLALLLAMGFHRHNPIFGIQGATVGNMLPGAIGLLLLTILASTLTVALYRPIASRLGQIFFLLWCVAAFYSNTSPGPVAQYLSFTRLPLIPITACYSLGATGTISLYSFAMLLVTTLYIVALVMLIDFLFRKRDLILQ